MSRLRKTEATAPGKLILSGEHAVVYGQPAVAAAIDMHVHTTIQNLPSRNNTVSVSLQHRKSDNEQCCNTYCWDTMQSNAQSVWRRYQAQQPATRDRHHVVQNALELLQVIVVHTLQQLNLSLRSDIHVRVQANTAIGCGLGSSASLIVSVMHAVATHFGMRPSTKWYYEQAVALENLQHARSSGIDPYTCLQGGCHLFQQGQAQTIPPPTWPLVLVHTGKPLSHTGQCVLQVKQRWEKSSIWQAFAQTTHHMHQALQNQDVAACQQAINHNHQLLNTLGVVPKRVAQFIAAVAQQGAAAKICGAGATQGNNGGMVWVLATQPSFLPHLCKQYGYCHITASVCMQGARTW